MSNLDFKGNIHRWIHNALCERTKQSVIDGISFSFYWFLFYWIRNVTSQYSVQITTWPSLHVKSQCRLLCLPSIEVEIYCFTSDRSFVCHKSVMCLCVLSVYHAGGQTRDVDPMPGYCWPTVYDAEPTLAQYWVTVSCLMPRWMWASITDGGPILTQPLFLI